ncbi:MAG: cupin domain-containing protein [Planctomycetota bacterium]|jgi:quercetin dioxygenase-like cupin family protein|nr:cupin domain-containing protein [Planctomycetota bacterium]
MKVINHQSVEINPVDMEGAVGCSMRQLVSEADGAPNFSMRQFEVEPGGNTPLHSHPYEHEVFVLQGDGIVMEGPRERPIKKGDVVYVAPDDLHQFKNSGQEPLRFLCLVPNDFASKPISCAVDSGNT